MLALILGGTKGLGLELAKQAKTYGVSPVLVGRTAPSFSAPFIEADLRWTHAHRRILAALGSEIQNTAAAIMWNEANAQASNSCLELRIPRSPERPPPYERIIHFP